MAIQKLEFERVWTIADDDEKGFRTYQDSEDQVREDLQYHPDAIKDYINETLLTGLEGSEGAAAIGDDHTGVLADTLDDLYDKIAAMADDLETLAEGDLPGSLRGNRVTFESGAWVPAADGHTLTLTQTQHGRGSATFGYRLWAYVDGTWRSDVWAVAGTRVEYREDGTVLLTAEEPYAGQCTFFGA